MFREGEVVGSYTADPFPLTRPLAALASLTACCIPATTRSISPRDLSTTVIPMCLIR